VRGFGSVQRAHSGRVTGLLDRLKVPDVPASNGIEPLSGHRVDRGKCFDLVTVRQLRQRLAHRHALLCTDSTAAHGLPGPSLQRRGMRPQFAGPDLDHRRQLQPTTHGGMYGMQKTTVYLPAELKTWLRRMARDTGISEAELIRQAVSEKMLQHPRPRPRVPLTDRGLGDPEAAHRVDELLAGFGYR